MVLRVIAGEYRRRLLKTPSGDSTRPYTDRVRTSVFARLEQELEGARVADVFSGVGTMGLESLSRGAASCVFFEGDPDTFAFMKSNVQTIAADSKYICWCADVRRTSFRPQGGEDFIPYTLIFFDPPYAMVPQLEPGKPLAGSLKRLAKPEISDPNVSLILRTPERTEIQSIGPWFVEDRWDLSSMIIWKMKKEGSETEVSP